MAVQGGEKYGRCLPEDVSGQHIKTTETGAQLRIIAKDKPMDDAILVEKNLEDAFLLYFGERSEEVADA